MTSIYILSDSTNLVRYKVGSHTGDLSKLKSRYITAIPTLLIHYFIETFDAVSIENKFKQKHVNERIQNSNGNTSEWVTMELNEIIVSLFAIVLQCNNSKINETMMITKNETQRSESSPPQRERNSIYGLTSPAPIQLTTLPPPLNSLLPDSVKKINYTFINIPQLRQLCEYFGIHYTQKCRKGELIEELSVIPESQITSHINYIKDKKYFIICDGCKSDSWKCKKEPNDPRHFIYDMNSILQNKNHHKFIGGIHGDVKCKICKIVCSMLEHDNKFYRDSM
jgi:hypothetical protein